MKKVSIEQWFEHIRDQRIPESDKQHIYNTINEQINRTLFISKFRRYVKAWSLVGALWVAAVLFFAAYSPTSLNDILVNDDWRSVVTTINQNNRAIVSADSVGKLIKVEGDIAIFKDNQEIITESLDAWDRVFLKENARVELTVREWVKATITGPAEFVIERIVMTPTSDVYTLNLKEGEYVEVKALPKKREDTTTQSKTPKKTETVVVKTPTLEIQQLPATKNLAVTISTQDGRPTVENDGDDIIVKLLDEDNEWSITVLARNETYTVEEKELTKENIEQLAQELEEDDFAIRYEVEEDATALITAELPDEKDENDNEMIVVDSTDSIRVLDADTLEILEKFLSEQYAQRHIDDAIQYADNSDAQTIALSNLAWSINSARSSVLLAPVWTSLEEIKSGVIGLQVHLQEKYFVSPWLIKRLYTIQSLLESITPQ